MVKLKVKSITGPDMFDIPGVSEDELLIPGRLIEILIGEVGKTDADMYYCHVDVVGGNETDPSPKWIVKDLRYDTFLAKLSQIMKIVNASPDPEVEVRGFLDWEFYDYQQL